jgi:ubiquinone/menaquinone biosynthesis C-methylase UbiE
MLQNYFKDGLNTFQAKSEIQKLTFYPIIFQAARVMLSTGILNEIFEHKTSGITASDISKKLGLPYYGVNTLLEVGLTIGLVFLKEEDKYSITKMGYFLLRDKATQVNLDFTHYVCYKAMFHLEESIKQEKPVGLKEIGLEKYPTIYPGLSELDETVKKSWFDFDHYYSDSAFPIALKIVFHDNPKHIVDIGGNTGKWSIACCKYNQTVKMTIVDLNSQLSMAKENIKEFGFENRISSIKADVLCENLELPKDANVFWMSQFLDCFSEEQILKILVNINNTINENSYVYILELFWDRQKELAAAYCLHGTSLYFTAVANGNSKMYHSKDMIRIIKQAGFEVIYDEDNIGEFHTLLKCKKVNNVKINR